MEKIVFDHIEIGASNLKESKAFFLEERLLRSAWLSQ